MYIEKLNKIKRNFDVDFEVLDVYLKHKKIKQCLSYKILLKQLE